MNATFLTTRRWMSLAFCLLLPAGAAVAQSVVRSFEGDAGPGIEACKAGGNHCGRQPEMNAAGNGAHVVQVTWQSVRVHDYDGKLLRSTPFADFARAAGLDPATRGGRGPFEPHVVFNEFIQRWIITSSCKDDCIIVSSSPDPLEPWKGVNVTCLQGGPCLDSNPGLKLGYDRNGVYYCGGHHGDENANTVPEAAYDCFAIPSAEVEAMGRGVEPKHLNRRHNMPLDITPAIDNNPAKQPTDPAFFMNKSCDKSAPYACQRSTITNYPFNWIVNTFTWNGLKGTYNWGGTQQVVKTDVGSKADKWVYNTPCCGENFSIPQAGTDVTIRAAGSRRVLNVVQTGSHLHGVLGSGPCTNDCGTQGKDTSNLMIYVDLDCSNPKACVVHDTAKISGADFNPEFGTVGVDTQGNIGILAMSSTASTHLGILGWSRKAGEKTFRGPKTLIKGTQPHTCTPDQKMVNAGSTVGIPTVRDTKDGLKLWTSLQWSNDATPCVFNTRIIQYQLADAPAVNKEDARR